MYEFDYHQPENVEDAAKLLSTKENAKPLAGGMSLLPSLKLRLARYTDLVGLEKLAIKGVERRGDTLIIGAMTRHHDVASSATVQQAIPALAALAGGIGDPLVRNRGTIGGSIANADPAADYPSSILGLNASVETDKRIIPADEFFTGLFETALEPDEIITAVHFPIPASAVYLKLPNAASRFAVVGIFLARSGDRIRVAVTGAGPYVFRLKDAEEALSADLTAKAIENFTISAEGLNTDIHASAEYRAHAVANLLRRAVAEMEKA